ncbi:KRR1 small subunit processome component, partial [Gregarina niphandrodes]
MSREETVTIDYWKEPEFNEDDVKGPFFEESSFQVVFPETRAKYIQQTWDTISAKLSEFRLKGDLDLVEKTMTVSTT